MDTTTPWVGAHRMRPKRNAIHQTPDLIIIVSWITEKGRIAMRPYRWVVMSIIVHGLYTCARYSRPNITIRTCNEHNPQRAVNIHIIAVGAHGDAPKT